MTSHQKSKTVQLVSSGKYQTTQLSIQKTEVKVEETTIALISAKQYQQIFQKQVHNPSSIQYKIYQTLHHYEAEVEILNHQVYTLEEKIKLITSQQQTLEEEVTEPLDENQFIYANSASFQENKDKAKELAELIDDKLEMEIQERNAFFTMLTEQYENDEDQVQEGIELLEKLINRKLINPYYSGFKAITRDDPDLKINHQKRNKINMFIHLVNQKIKSNKQFAFRSLLKGLDQSTISDQQEAPLKLKGKVLFGLKEYPRVTKRHAFFNWYLKSTIKGDNLLQTAADNLVLYTNINKTTGFYRLFKKVKGKKRVVSPRVKRMTTMIYLYSRIFFERQKQHFFQKLKTHGEKKSRASECGLRLIESAKSRRKEAIQVWMKKIQRQKEGIRRLSNILKKKLKSVIKQVGEYIIKESIDKKREKESRFTAGLSRYVERTLTRAFNAFKNEFELGQAAKKRAVIQLINVTMGGQKKLYQRWIGITQKTRLLNECKLIGNIFTVINYAIKSVSDNLYANNKDNQIKENALLKIFANMNNGVGEAFRKWRQTNKIQKIKNKMNDQQKKITLNLLNNLLNNDKTKQIRQAINKFKNNRKIIDIQRNFLKRLLMSKAGLVLIAFKKFISLPQKFNKDKNDKANRFSAGLSRYVERTLTRAFNAFKNEFELGQAAKKRAVIQLINVTMGGQKKLYQRWIGITQKTRLLNECKLIGNIFTVINYAIKSVSDNLYANNKDNQIKENALLKIFANMNNGVGEAFRKWRQTNKIQKIKNKMNDQQKKITLNLLNNLLNNDKTKQIRQAINKFKNNRKIIDIQRNFLKRLLMSKAGLVLIAFKKFISLPQKFNKDKNDKANRFSAGLSRYVERTLTRAFNAFKNEFELGQAAKKRAVIQLINVTMGGQKKLYQRWIGITQKTRLLNECKLIGNIFTVINYAIKSVSDNLYANNKDNQIKENALLKIFANMNNGVGEAFRKWRQTNKIQKIKNKMNDQQKKITLNLLNNLLNNDKTKQIRQAINKFKNNRKIIDIQRNFLKRLLMSKAGLVLIAFKKFISLPQKFNKDKNDKANRFSAGLSRYVERTLTRAFNAFKNEFELGQAAKKRAVIQLINVTMGGQKKLYQRWIGITQKTRLLNECKLIGNIFTVINYAIKSVSDNLYANNKDNQIKENALLKIFANMNNGVGEAFRKWRQTNKIQKIKNKMNDQQKKITLNLLNNLLNNDKTKQIRQAINKFKNNRKIIDIQRNFLKRLLMSKAGLVLIAFKKFISLPQKFNKDKNDKANRFSAGLSRYVERTLTRAFNAFKNEFELGQAAKKRAVIQLINVTMGGQKKLYQRWIGITQKTRLLNECKLIGNIFTVINYAIKSVSDNLYANNKDNQIKENALLKIFANMNNGVGEAFRKWRQTNKIQKIKNKMNDQQKKITLNLLNNLLNNDKTKQIRQAINKFKNNRKIIDIQRNFLKRLLMSKAGLVLIAFKKFISLPQKFNKDKNDKANRFSAGLSRYVERTLTRAFNAFKNEFELGQAAKKRAVIQLINVTMGGQKKLYQRWIGITQKTRLLNECKLIGNIFTVINYAIKSVSDNLYANNKDNQIKENALLKIFANMNNGVGEAFRKWRQTNKIQKIKNKMNDQQKKITLNLLNNLLNNDKTKQIRQAINKFKNNRKIIDIQRNFLKRLLMSKAGLVLIAFKKFISLPQKFNKDKNDKANRFSAGLSRYVERTLTRAFNAFKNEFELGQAAKKRAVIQLINVTMGGQKKLYQRWIGITQKTRLLNECKLIGNIFTVINYAIKSVSDNLYANNKDNQIKENALLKIFANMNNGVGEAFRKWRQTNKIQKIKNKMNDQQKKITLNLLNNLLNNDKTKQIRQAINKFKNNRKIIDIQRNFLKRLLMSKAGLVLIAFKKFISLPQKFNKDKNDKANRFSAGLSRYVERTLTRAFNAFKNEFELGQAAKKRAVIQLINVTMGGQKKLYQRWIGITQKTRLLNECKLIGNIFTVINYAIKSVSDNLYANNKDNQIKENALLKIFANMNNGVGEAFRKWRQTNKIQKIKNKMNDQQKKITLNLLNNLLNNDKTKQIRQAINKFKNNRKIIDIQRNFLKRLLMSKAGLVLIAFKKFISLPQKFNKDKNDKANRFSAGLSRYVERTLTRAFNAFKNEFELGQAAKKRAVIQLINVTMGGQKKLYQRWIGITQKTRLLNECKLIGNIFTVINYAIKSVSDNLYANNKDNQIKENALLKIFANMNNGVGEAFRKWRQTNKIQKIKNKMNDQQKKITLNLLNNLLNNDKTKQIRQAINKFKNNRKIIDIQRNFLKRLLMSKAGLVLIAFKKFISLPQKFNKDKNDKANRFSAGLSRYVERTLTRAFNAFKNEFELGQAAKKRAVIQLINVTMGGQKKLYQRWIGITQKTRLLNECKLIGNIFTVINYAIKSVSDNLYANNKDNQIKENALLKIFANMNNGVGEAFRKWRQTNKIQKIKNKMNDQQKKITLNLLNNLLNNDKTKQIRQAINKFKNNRKIIDIQRNFLKRLLMSKAGLVLIAFKKFISLPQKFNKDKNDKANRFSAGLSRYVERTLTRAFNAFKNEFELGQAAKKRAVIQLINVTMGGQKKLYQRWIGITQKTRLLNECKLIGNIFTVINYAIKSVSDNLYANNKDNQIKENALLKIFANMNNGVGEAFRKWRQTNKIQKIKNKMNDQQKKITLNLLNNLLNNDKTKQIRQAINKFKNNRKIIDIQRNFLKRLLMSKAGLVLIAFKKFISLPQKFNKDKNDKANRFSAGLSRYVERTLTRAFNAFKNEFELGQAAKKRAVIQLINVTMGGQKKLYQRWIGITQKTRLLNECKLIGNIFTVINYAIKSVSDNLYANNKDNQIKENALLKIFANMNNGVGEAFRKWRQTNKIQKIKNKMNDQQKKITLNLLNNLLNNDKTKQIRQAINKFKNNRKIIDIQRNFLKRLLMSKAGLVLIAFKKFISLPQKFNKDKNDKANRFSAGLSRYVERTLTRAFNAFKNEFELGQAAKKRAVIQLINVTMGGQKKLYQRWIGITQKTRLLNECKLIGNIFTVINYAIKSVSDNLYANNKDNQIKENALLKIFANMNNGVGEAFRKWRQTNKIQKIKNKMNDQQKKITLNLLNNLLNNDKTKQIRQAINKFKNNRKIIDIQRNFLKRLLMSKAGLVLIAFKKFISLPQKFNKDKNDKANRFSAGLSRYVERTLTRAFNAFKNEFELGQAAKKRAVIQLINVTMGGQKKLYQRWIGITQKTRLLNECKLIGNIFTVINYAIKSVSDNLYANNKDNQIKENALLKIFANMNNGVGEAFRKWRQTNKIQKIKNKMNDQQKKITLNLLNNLLNNDKTKQIRQAINKFKNNRKIIDIQRNFLKRLLMSKAGLVLIAFKKFISLPQKFNKDKNDKANRFSAGLSRYVERTLTRAFNAFKNEFELGQAAKKRAVIQLINVTMGGQKKLYQRWIGITQKTRLLNECKLIGNIFTVINYAIKSVSDNLYANNKDNQIKENALLKIFANMNNGVGEAFRKWRQTNKIQKIKNKMNDQQKKITLNLLNNLLNNDKTKQIRQAINKFKNNRKIIDIQRNFLKRLLMSKAGLVLIAFKKFISLPQKFNKDKNDKANRFSAGLSRYVERTLTRAFNAFKNEFELGQAAKKRAVIQLINVTKSGQRKFYQRWLQSLHDHKILRQSLYIQSLFNHATSSVSKTYLPLLKTGIKPSYTLSQIENIQAYLHKVVAVRQQNYKTAFQILYLNYYKSKTNPWFKKSAFILALNTRVNTQKSFWRLKQNIHSTGVIYNAAIIVKLKKLFNNLRKYYELNMYKIFLTIDKYGRNLQQAQNARVRQSRMTGRQTGMRATERFQAHHQTHQQQQFFFNQQQQIQQITITEVQQNKIERILYTNRNQAVRAMQRIFKKNIKKRLSTWRKATSTSNQIQRITSSIDKQQYSSISRYGAADVIIRILKSYITKQQFRGFKAVQSMSAYQTTENAYDRSLDQRLQLINRQNILMEQIRSYKFQNEQLSIQCENKQKCLRECNETVTLLSLRINYMITQKFVVILEKVYDAVEFRNVNDAFDYIIEQANQNYERQELQDI